MSEQVDDPKADLSAAFDQVQGEQDAGAGKEETGGSAEDTKEPERPAGKKEEPEQKSEAKTDEAGGEEGKKESAEEEVKSAPERKKETSGRAPASWKPDAREHWAKLPEPVRNEISRRERDTTLALQQSADARRFAQEFQNVVRPFEGFIAAERSTPLQSVQNLMATAVQLRVGTPIQKAQVVASIIKQYGIDIATLDSTLAGEVPQGGANADVLRLLEERLAPVNQFINGLGTQNQQRLVKEQETVQTELQTFAEDPAHEFFEDVREEMSVLLGVAAQRGRVMTLKEAYDRACQNIPEVSGIVTQRNEAKRAAEEAERIAKKKEAGASIRGTAGAGATAPKGSDDVRADIRAAMEGR